MWWVGASLGERSLVARSGVVRPSCVIVHAMAGRRRAKPRTIAVPRSRSASCSRPGMRSARTALSEGPCVMRGTSAFKSLDNVARIITRRSFGRSRRSLGAARTEESVAITAVSLKLQVAFRNSGKDLEGSGLWALGRVLWAVSSGLWAMGYGPWAIGNGTATTAQSSQPKAHSPPIRVLSAGAGRSRSAGFRRSPRRSRRSWRPASSAPPDSPWCSRSPHGPGSP